MKFTPTHIPKNPQRSAFAISVVLPEEIFAEVQKLSEKLDIKKSPLVKQMIEHCLKEMKAKK